jgi:hypothetical protein
MRRAVEIHPLRSGIRFRFGRANSHESIIASPPQTDNRSPHCSAGRVNPQSASGRRSSCSAWPFGLGAGAANPLGFGSGPKPDSCASIKRGACIPQTPQLYTTGSLALDSTSRVTITAEANRGTRRPMVLPFEVERCLNACAFEASGLRSIATTNSSWVQSH